MDSVDEQMETGEEETTQQPKNEASEAMDLQTREAFENVKLEEKMESKEHQSVQEAQHRQALLDNIINVTQVQAQVQESEGPGNDRQTIEEEMDSNEAQSVQDSQQKQTQDAKPNHEINSGMEQAQEPANTKQQHSEEEMESGRESEFDEKGSSSDAEEMGSTSKELTPYNDNSEVTKPQRPETDVGMESSKELKPNATTCEVSEARELKVDKFNGTELDGDERETEAIEKEKSIEFSEKERNIESNENEQNMEFSEKERKMESSEKRRRIEIMQKEEQIGGDCTNTEHPERDTEMGSSRKLIKDGEARTEEEPMKGVDTHSRGNVTPKDGVIAALPTGGGGGGGSSTVSLHPLVILNISEHWTRVRSQNNGQQQEVIGALLGLHEGRRIEIQNSFELVQSQNEGGDITVSTDYFLDTRTRFREVFSKMDVLGWYTTGAQLTTSDLDVQKQFLEHQEHVLFLKLNPFQIPGKQLPVKLYESTHEFVEGKFKLQFVGLKWSLVSGDAESIGIDHMVSFTADGKEQSITAANLQVQETSVRMLEQQIRLLLQYVQDVQSGQLAMDHTILRDINNVCDRLTSMASLNAAEDMMKLCMDVRLMGYQGILTKLCNTTLKLVTKLSLTGRRKDSQMGCNLLGHFGQARQKVCEVLSGVQQLRTEAQVNAMYNPRTRRELLGRSVRRN